MIFPGSGSKSIGLMENSQTDPISESLGLVDEIAENLTIYSFWEVFFFTIKSYVSWNEGSMEVSLSNEGVAEVSKKFVSNFDSSS